ncbi:acetyl-CoA carboxylase biotin carboxylase subunit [Affinibrenneria salicis]|uniref:Biotin carboxylase n=1 Tax=Affinibrenneria salicis TaxID=2590031 RepID=A0A5J5FZK9_9GAMM|nr:acetyl-CoA carboxylase biotin carboxylase subunit [Affinibrenneria salicis]KAA8999364.1 acetyl-CoA carboxylase biotin carboxylase subunit [Affinibrenneria salicis]
MNSAIKKLLIANRGEIAVRIIRAAQALGIPTVAACSEADADSLPARMADEVQIIGPARADQSYLNPQALLQAALRSGANALHPGYGFLSENAHFTQLAENAGLIYVGPQAETIRIMGDKAAARRTAQEAGVPVVPGSKVLETLDAALRSAAEIGYPLLIKAAAGGGGRGIRAAASDEQLAREFPIAQSESKAAFGSSAIYLERFIPRARHIEVQILGDGERAIHLFERECSLQRRRQKIFEEAPSPALSAAQRQALCDSALRLAQHLRYRGAGTLEYLFDENSGQFYFIEMNTRIQVEHPVTEMITGVDLVQWMLRIAGGEKLTLRQQDIAIHGCACEMRINAEDPDRGFFPCPGTLDNVIWPSGDGIRVDSHVFSGYPIPPYYDSLLAKLIVHGERREQTLARASQALTQLRLSGVKTTQPLHQWLLNDPRLLAGRFDTTALEQWLAERHTASQAALPEV